ncbi:MAG: macro domain-containing protein [Christensenellaceae bacterium]|nr:macro domain-containing protein [Christensenellaceae bacterium]MBR3842392.1 macro domain-containing protein [Christensenellaceae bacterium]
MAFHIIKGDIIKMKVDAIVNAANSSLQNGGGVCGTIFRHAGEEALRRECEKIGGCETGFSVITKGYALQAKYIIHSVGPVWRGGVAGEEFLLRSCYRSALELAAKHRISSIAFPLISSGIYGYPKEEALNIAVDEIGKFALLSDMEIFLVIYNAEDFVIDDALRKEVAAYIAEQKALPEEAYPNIHFDFEVKEIDKPAISQPEKDFYRKANLSRADFMRISRPSVGKKISKDEVISMAIALEFDFEKAKAFLERFGYRFDKHTKDLIIRWSIENKRYDIFELIKLLFAFNRTFNIQ